MHNRFQQMWNDVRSRMFGGPARPVFTPALIFERFRKVLNSNNQSLEIIADLGEKLSGDYIFDRHYIETGVERLNSRVKVSPSMLAEKSSMVMPSSTSNVISGFLQHALM